MGSVKELYLDYEKAGVQYLGWVASGLNCSRYLFSASPPYFDFDWASGKGHIWKMLDDKIMSFIPQRHGLNSQIFCIFWFCFDSICVHSDFLN